MLNDKKIKIQDKDPPHSPLRTLLYLVMLLLLAILVIAAYSVIRRTASRIAPDFYFPFLKTARAAENLLADNALLLQDKRALAAELLKLRHERMKLLAERALVLDANRENSELRSMLGIREKAFFEPVFAQVLFRNEATPDGVFVLDKGADAGIAPGNIVLTPAVPPGYSRAVAAVAGRVKSVTKHTSAVSSLSDPDFRLGVSVSGSGAPGLLMKRSGVEPPFSSITFLPVGAKISDGDIVRTNTFTDNHPPGLPVGMISAGKGKPAAVEHDHVYLEARLRLFAEPGRFRFAAVYVRKQGRGNTSAKNAGHTENTGTSVRRHGKRGAGGG